jgi:hypothetical protein
MASISCLKHPDNRKMNPLCCRSTPAFGLGRERLNESSAFAVGHRMGRAFHGADRGRVCARGGGLTLIVGSGNLHDPGKLTYIGSPGAVNSVLYVRSGTGITTFADLKSSARQLTFGALGSTTATAMVPALLAADGWPIKVVLGYVSTARVLLAL